MPGYQLLVYPVTDALAPRVDAGDSLLTSAHMRWFTTQYLPDQRMASHAWASPLRARHLRNLPPAGIVLAEHDPLRAEGAAYADRLRRHGVPVEEHVVPGLFHGLLGLGALVPVARAADDLVVRLLQSTLTSTRTSSE